MLCILLIIQDLAVEELRRCIEELGLRGIQIGSHIKHEDGDWNLNRREFDPIWAVSII